VKAGNNNYMTPQIIAQQNYSGLQQDMTYAAYKPTPLWQRFIYVPDTSSNAVRRGSYSVQVFSATFGMNLIQLPLLNGLE
jgi:hypothetical protein